MTVLWAANATKHSAVAFYHEGFEYRAPTIKGGGQMRLFDGTIEECLAIVRQIGALHVGDSSALDRVCPLIYSLDTPVPDETIRAVSLRNKQLLSDKGYRSRVGITAPAVIPEFPPDEPDAEESAEPS